jgi:hypothetical protein
METFEHSKALCNNKARRQTAVRQFTFGTLDTDHAATEAACVNVADLQSKESITKFLHALWGHISNALDHAEYKPEHGPALKQLEVELFNYVATLRGQVLPR